MCMRSAVTGAGEVGEADTAMAARLGRIGGNRGSHPSLLSLTSSHRGRVDNLEKTRVDSRDDCTLGFGLIGRGSGSTLAELV